MASLKMLQANTNPAVDVVADLVVVVVVVVVVPLNM